LIAGAEVIAGVFGLCAGTNGGEGVPSGT
jgi:hypothetical protein